MIVFVVVAIVAIGYAIWLLINWCADHDYFWTRLPEGQIMVAMSGKTPIRWFASLTDHVIDMRTGRIAIGKTVKDWIPLDMETNGDWTDATMTEDQKLAERKKIVPAPETFLGRWGCIWMGIPPIRPYKYEFKWIKLSREVNETDYKFEPREDKQARSIFFNATYGLPVVQAKTKTANIRVDLGIQYIIEIVNANSALFRTPHYLDGIVGQLLAAIRDFVASEEWSALVGDQHEIGKKVQLADKCHSAFIDAIMTLNTRVIGNQPIMTTFGARIKAVSVLWVNTSGENATAVMEAINAQFLAEEKGNALITQKTKAAEARRQEGDGEADYIRKIGQAEADATLARGTAAATVLGKKRTELGDDSNQIGLVVQGEAIKETELGALAIGTPTTTMFPVSGERKKKKEEDNSSSPSGNSPETNQGKVPVDDKQGKRIAPPPPKTTT